MQDFNKSKDDVPNKKSQINLDGDFRIEDLDKAVFETFNKDLKKRLEFVGKVLDWERFGESLKGKSRSNGFKPTVQDGELTEEHFTFSKSNLNYLMDKVYFPVIDAQEHLNLFTTSDFAIKLEHEKYQDMLLVELISLQ